MKLLLENYKNIQYTLLELPNAKINFIFGISGSGKSSIADALSGKVDDICVRIGCNKEDMKILLDNKEVSHLDYNVFNQEDINRLKLYSTDNNETYNILFSDNEVYNERINEFKQELNELEKHRVLLEKVRRQVEDLNTLMNLKKLTSRNKVPKTTLPFKISNILDNISNTSSIELANKYGQDKVLWIKQGFGLLNEDKICPFCLNDNIGEQRFIEIKDLTSIDKKLFEALLITDDQYHELGVDPPNLMDKTTLDNVVELIRKKNLLYKDVVKLLEFMDGISDIVTDVKGVRRIRLSESFKAELPKVYEVVQQLNEKMSSLQGKINRINYSSKHILNENKKAINNHFEVLGIKYTLVEQPLKHNEKKGSFILKHNDDTTTTDMIEGLSTGEKNLVALVLFLIKNKNKKMIIDDPASSFDDYRRKSIYDLVMKYSKRSTVVLSHDHIFAKYAVKSKYKDNVEKIGKILYMTNFNGYPIYKDVKLADFKELRSWVLEQLDSTQEYYSKIISLRILYELDKQSADCNHLEYGYLSAILHQTSYESIMKLIEEKRTSEQYILDLIYDKYNFNLNELSRNYINEIDNSNLSNFEKVFKIREEVKGTFLEKELSNIIHINDSLAVCLNPYKYDYFSPYVYKTIVNFEE